MINSFLIKIVFLLFGKSIKENLLKTNELSKLSIYDFHLWLIIHLYFNIKTETDRDRNEVYTYYKNTKEHEITTYLIPRPIKFIKRMNTIAAITILKNVGTKSIKAL